MELLASDMRLVEQAMKGLDAACKEMDGHAYTVHLLVTNECGDEFRIGYGENAEPALLGFTESASDV